MLARSGTPTLSTCLTRGLAMTSGTLKDLAQLHGRLAVSILCPFNTRMPGNGHDLAVLRGLRDSAAGQVRAALPGEAGASLIAHLDEAVATVDLQHPSEAVAVMVSPGVSRVITLDAPVEPSVVVGERFAMRDLLTAKARAVRARIILLSQEKSRCLDLTGREIVERHDFGFPVEVVAATEADTPHGAVPLDEYEHAEAAKFVFRAVARTPEGAEPAREPPDRRRPIASSCGWRN